MICLKCCRYKLYVFIKTENISIWISKIKIEGDISVKLGEFFTFIHVFSGFAEKQLIIPSLFMS